MRLSVWEWGGNTQRRKGKDRVIYMCTYTHTHEEIQGLTELEGKHAWLTLESHQRMSPEL